MQAGDHGVIDPHGDGEQRPHEHPRIGRHKIEADPQQQTGARIGVQAVEEVAENSQYVCFQFVVI